MHNKFHALPVAAVASSIFLLAQLPATADTIENCGVTNSALCNAVQSHTQPGITVYGSLPANTTWIDDTFNGTQINFSDGNSGLAEQAYASLATGTLRLSAQSYGSTSYDALYITAGDFFTIAGPPGTVSLSAQLLANGTADLPSVGSSGLNPSVNLTAWVQPPGGSYIYAADFFQISYSVFNLPNPSYSGPIYSVYSGQNFLDASSQTWTETVGVPFYFSYGLQAQVTDGGDMNVLHTGTLSFNLPAGYTIQSQGGFSSAPASVPEPSSAVLALTVVACFAWCRRRSQRL
jgi:hypothetical protein